MENKLSLRSIFLFTVCLARSLASGADGKTSLHSNKTLPRSSSTNEKLKVYRNEYAELGTTVTLNCTNTKIAWRDMIFVIWKFHLQGKECIIAMANNDSYHDTCQDGKKLKRTSEGTYHLIIPNFSVQDERNYTCDISYQSGGSVEVIKVSAFARPQLSGWLESENGHTVAVCEAKAKSAATIHWETPWNSSSPITQTSKTQDQLFTVISHLHLPRHASHTNLTCLATANDPKHTKTRFSNFAFRDAHVAWPFILVGVCVTCFIITLLTGLDIILKKLTELRNLCCKPDTQEVNNPEELHLYARCGQREDIYSSLWTPSTLETHDHTHVYANA